MSEKRKRNSYSPEFKAKVGLEAIHGDKPVGRLYDAQTLRFAVCPRRAGIGPALEPFG